MPFLRDVVRHPLTVRRLTVAAVREVVPTMVRITLTGPELAGFSALGPADHVKVFFPDPATGTLTLPGVDEQGLRRETTAGTIISRDYTPLFHRPEIPELDIDFVIHGDEGPASAWASRAQVGDELGIGGPRGSRLMPEGIGGLIVIADETGLPASRRWIERLPEGVPFTAIFEVADERVRPFDDIDAEWLFREDGPGQLDEALRSLGPIGDDTFVFLAGEANALVPLRRYLRHELGLPADQVSASGYWKRGIVNLDHHAPLDPSDPD